MALDRGLGRAILALEGHRYANIILAACLENPHYDRQCEENRAPYFLQILRRAGLKDRAREAILEALPKMEDSYDRDWMVDLLEFLAKDGDMLAWEALRDLAADGYERAQDNLASTNEDGLQWVVDNVLPSLAEDDRWRLCMWLPDEEEDDKTALLKWLREIDQKWTAERRAKPQEERGPSPTVRAFFQSLDDPSAPRVSVYKVAPKASRKDRHEAARRLLQAKDHRTAWRLATFSGGIDFHFRCGCFSPKQPTKNAEGQFVGFLARSTLPRSDISH